MKVKINNVRLAFPQLFEATTVNGEGKPAFSATFILPQNHPDISRGGLLLCVSMEWSYLHHNSKPPRGERGGCQEERNTLILYIK
jgi:hypothetical protein